MRISVFTIFDIISIPSTSGNNKKNAAVHVPVKPIIIFKGISCSITAVIIHAEYRYTFIVKKSGTAYTASTMHTKDGIIVKTRYV